MQYHLEWYTSTYVIAAVEHSWFSYWKTLRRFHVTPVFNSLFHQLRFFYKKRANRQNPLKGELTVPILGMIMIDNNNTLSSSLV